MNYATLARAVQKIQSSANNRGLWGIFASEGKLVTLAVDSICHPQPTCVTSDGLKLYVVELCVYGDNL